MANEISEPNLKREERNIAKLYRDKVYPFIDNVRGSNLVLRVISDLVVTNNEGDFCCNGVTVSEKVKDLSPNVARSLVSGGYEEDEVRACKKYLNKKDDVVELGGGIGFLSCFVDTILEDGEHVVVEPNPDLKRLIKENKVLNDAKYSFVEAAYSPKDSQTFLSETEEFWGAVTNEETGKYRVEGVSLKTLIKNFQISEFTLICDIEGVEMALVTEEAELLDDKCKTIIIETHGNKKSVLSVLLEKNFEVIDSFGSVQVLARGNIC